MPHPAAAMFDLVADVERYPDFIPFCEALIVRERREEGRKIVLIAEMAVGYKRLRESFTSRVTLDREALAILSEGLGGPFRRMENRWTFRPPGESACEVHFAIDYDFRSRTLGLLMGAMFDRVFRSFASAFEARADAIYGRDRVGFRL